jgi:hypothetical protein
MPGLIVRIKKKTDGAAALSCERADGSVTWQRQDGQLGRFFPMHDLTHFAVESVLGLHEAFYGMIASGKDIADTGKKPVPEQAHLSEVIVGFFDLERRTGDLAGAGELNARIETYFGDKKLPVPAFRMTDEQVAAIRRRRAELFEQWQTVPPGETLELRFQ